MTPSEFKAWFDGFTEAFDKTPSQKQWARIKERVAEIDGKPVTEKVFVDRYWPGRPWHWSYWPYYGSLGAATYGGMGISGTGIGSNTNQTSQAYQNALGGSLQGQSLGNLNATYNSTQAMNALGRSEAQAMS